MATPSYFPALCRVYRSCYVPTNLILHHFIRRILQLFPRIHGNTGRTPQQTKEPGSQCSITHLTKAHSSGHDSSAHALASFGRGQAHMKRWEVTAEGGPCLFFGETGPRESTVAWCDWRCYYPSAAAGAFQTVWIFTSWHRLLFPPIPEIKMCCRFAVLPGTKS